MILPHGFDSDLWPCLRALFMFLDVCFPSAVEKILRSSTIAVFSGCPGLFMWLCLQMYFFFPPNVTNHFTILTWRKDTLTCFSSPTSSFLRWSRWGWAVAIIVSFPACMDTLLVFWGENKNCPHAQQQVRPRDTEPDPKTHQDKTPSEHTPLSLHRGTSKLLLVEAERTLPTVVTEAGHTLSVASPTLLQLQEHTELSNDLLQFDCLAVRNNVTLTGRCDGEKVGWFPSTRWGREQVTG